MFFTREDILKIQQALLQLGVKDSELPSAEPVTYDDTLSIVQEGKNKQIGIKDFFNQISLWKREDFLNITDRYEEHYISLREAINLVPILQRKDGLVITFQDVEGNWEIYQFRGNITEFLNEDKWFDLYDYKNYIIKSFLPDEEDITALTPDKNGNSFLALKDRIYNPTLFNGKGYKILRKNFIDTELAVIKINIVSPTFLEGDIDFNINNKSTKVHLSPTIHNTTKLVSEAIKDALIIACNDYEVTVVNSVIILTRKYSGNTSPTTFEMYNTGVKVIVEDSTIIDKRNVITQEDINKTDTIYEIRYDFNLDGKTITIPKNCILYFTSGKFYNGSINMDNTIISTFSEEILSEININGDYHSIQKSIDKLNDIVFPITLNFYVNHNVGTMNSTINYSIISDNRPLIPDTLKITKKINDEEEVIITNKVASSGSINTAIEGCREIFKFEVDKMNRTGKSTNQTRYLCYYGGNNTNTITKDIINTLNKVSLEGVNFNLRITTKANDYIWLVVPNYLNIKRVTSAGFDITLTDIQSITTELGTFKAYRTVNPLTAQTWDLVIL